MRPDSVEKTAFIPDGLYEWLVMPFGVITNAQNPNMGYNNIGLQRATLIQNPNMGWSKIDWLISTKSELPTEVKWSI